MKSHSLKRKRTPKKPKAKLLSLPSVRKAKGFYFRHYFGGEFDGVREQVPIFVRATLRQTIDKPYWCGTVLEKHNEYSLATDHTKPVAGETYPYYSK